MSATKAEPGLRVPGAASGLFKRELLTDDGGPLTVSYAVALVLPVQGLAVAIFVVLSAVCNVSYPVYYGLSSALPIAWKFLAAGAAGAIALHALNWYNWAQLWLKVPCALVVAYILALGGLFYTRLYPAAPLMLAFLHFPLVMGVVRYLTAGRLSSKGFYQGMSLGCGLAALWVFVAWILWVGAANMSWNTLTKHKLHSRMDRIFDLYDVPSDWTSCALERAKADNAQDAALLRKCRELEQMTFLIWVCPLIEFGVLLGLASVAAARSFTSPKPGDPPTELADLERRLKMVMMAGATVIIGFWMGLQTMGASMGLSNLFLAVLLASGVLLCVWIVNSFDVELIAGRLCESVIWKLAKPFLSSDWFFAFMLCFAFFPLMPVLLLEFVVRQFERVRCVASESPWITDRGLWLCRYISSKHWASVLEKCFLLCITYFVFFLFDKFTAVFFGWLNGRLSALPYAAVVVIFYVTGIILFALPPMPGVPVYMAAGVILASQGKTLMTLPGAIAFACVVATLQKVAAVTVHQVLGYTLGRSKAIQQIVGVHTVEIRAIEKILRVRGLSLNKIYILCGGPDWPVSVLTGILKLSFVEVAIGTLPSFVLISPCVIAGACLMEEQLRSMSAVITMVVGITQGGLLLAACVATSREAERSHDELSVPKPEHAELLQLAEMSELKKQRYLEKTAWRRLACLQKGCLVSSVALVNFACGLLTVLSSLCFRNFEIGREIAASFEDGGLAGNVANVVRYPLGVAGIVLVGVGLLLHVTYALATCCARSAPTSTAVTPVVTAAAHPVVTAAAPPDVTAAAPPVVTTLLAPVVTTVVPTAEAAAPPKRRNLISL